MESFFQNPKQPPQCWRKMLVFSVFVLSIFWSGNIVGQTTYSVSPKKSSYSFSDIYCPSPRNLTYKGNTFRLEHIRTSGNRLTFRLSKRDGSSLMTRNGGWFNIRSSICGSLSTNFNRASEKTMSYGDRYWDFTLVASSSFKSGSVDVVCAIGIGGVSSDSNPKTYYHTAKITVTASTTSTPSGKPDLVVISESVDNTSPKQGDNISLNCKIKNSGSTQAPSSRLRYYLSKDLTPSPSEELDDDYVRSLSAGSSSSESASVTIPSSTPTGTYYILFVADADNDVSESSSRNNLEYVRISVKSRTPTGKPDFQVKNATVNKTTNLDPGDRVYTDCDIYNAGINYDGDRVYVAYYFSKDRYLSGDDTFLSDDSFYQLDANDYNSEGDGVNLPNNFTGTEAYIIFVVDYKHTVSETQEHNNTVAVKLRFNPPAPSPCLTPPSNLKVTLNGTAPQFTWNPVNETSRYKIEYQKTDGSNQHSGSSLDADYNPSYKTAGNWKCRVRSVCLDGTTMSNWSNWVYYTISQPCSVPTVSFNQSSPMQVRVGEKINLSWTPSSTPSGDCAIAGYEMSVRQVGGSWSSYVSRLGTSFSSNTISSANVGKTFEYKLRVKNKKGEYGNQAYITVKVINSVPR